MGLTLDIPGGAVRSAQVATVGELPTVALCPVEEPTVNSNGELTVATKLPNWGLRAAEYHQRYVEGK